MAPPSFAFEWMRRAVLALASDHPPLRSLINPRQTTAIHYKTSALNAQDSVRAERGPLAGMVLPECPVTLMNGDEPQAIHLTQCLSGGWALWLFQDHYQAVPLAQEWLRWSQDLRLDAEVMHFCQNRSDSSPTPYVWDEKGHLFPILGASAGCVMVIRPDGHVLGRWIEPTLQQLQQAFEPWTLHRSP